MRSNWRRIKFENMTVVSENKHGTGKPGIRRRMAPRLTIGVKFVSFVVLVTLLAGGIVGMVTINASRDSLRQEVLRDNLGRADLAAEFASNYVKVIQANLLSFAARSDIVQAVLDNQPERVQLELTQFAENQMVIASAGFYDEKGIQRVLSQTGANTIGQSFADRDYFLEPAKTLQPYLGVAVKSRATGLLVAPYGVPIVDAQGKFRGVISAGISLSTLSDAIVNIEYGTDTRASMIDIRNGGLIIADIDPNLLMTPVSEKNEAVSRALAGERGTIETAGSAGELDLVGFAPVPDLPWGIFVSTPSKTALAIVNTLTQNASLYTGLIILLAAIFGVILMLGVSRPLSKLIEGTKEIGRGNLDYNVAIASRDEIGDLSRAFGDMTEKLKNTLVSRDELVKEATERKKAEETLRETNEYLENLFNYANAPIIVWDTQFKITRFNHAFESLTGRNAREVIGQPIEILFPPALAGRSMELIRETMRGKRWESVDIAVLHLDGTIRIILWNSATILAKDGETPISTIAQGQDITGRKHAEEIIARSNMELQQFAQIISHDLQEPLRTIGSYLQLLERRYKDKLDKDAEEFIGFAVEGAKRMQDMIGGLLEYSRVETRGKQFVPVKCEEVLQAVIDNLQMTIADSGAQITHESLPVVTGDFNQLTQLFQNLIINGIKFRKLEQPRVHISALLEDREWVFTIRDNGIGIEPKYFDRLFRIFQRLHLREEYPGTGMGLAICKRIVERHGGRIWIESEFGKGSTFHFAIPIKGEG